MAPSVSHFPSTAPTLLPTLVPTMSPAPTATPVPTMGPTFIEIIHGHGKRDVAAPDPFMIAAATFGGMLLMLAALLIYRGCLKQRDYNYTRVHHGLDDEEQEFKKTLESQTDEIDDLFNFGNDQVSS
mmetsp:Transcript_17395/g.45135  ORF Transcript_17395/g.45135 Transcript_17395/m.45135 type:complete len:127 (+) Transcript_17395:235-615(+)